MVVVACSVGGQRRRGSPFLGVVGLNGAQGRLAGGEGAVRRNGQGRQGRGVAGPWRTPSEEVRSGLRVARRREVGSRAEFILGEEVELVDGQSAETKCSTPTSALEGGRLVCRTSRLVRVETRECKCQRFPGTRQYQAIPRVQYQTRPIPISVYSAHPRAYAWARLRRVRQARIRSGRQRGDGEGR